MYPNSFGERFKITTFGESHSLAVGVMIEGIKPGVKLDMAYMQELLNQRRPKSKLTTKRKEKDEFLILSGVFEGKTLGTPIVAMVYNKDARSKDYSHIQEVFRPSHADFTFLKKYGIRDYRGGGRASGRETVSRVLGGSVARSFLNEQGVEIDSRIVQIGSFKTEKWDAIVDQTLPFGDQTKLEDIQKYIEALDGDSVGGVIETRIQHLPIGIGEPVFEKLEANLAKAIMSIGAIKGVEFGLGFGFADKKGSEVNDQMNIEGFMSNYSGGIQGGISNGQAIVLRAVIKPTPSIGKKQQTLNTKKEEVELQVKGRHDPCIAIRMIPVMEAMVAMVLINMLGDQHLIEEEKKDLNSLRKAIFDLDVSIFSLLERRFELVKEVLKEKRKKALPVENKAVEADLIERIKSIPFQELQGQFIEKLYQLVFKESKSIQKRIQEKSKDKNKI